MTRALCVIVSMLAASVAGCGGPSGAGATPEATYQSFKATMCDRSFEDAWDLLSTASQQQFERDAEAKNKETATMEGPGRLALETQAKAIDMTLEDMKHLDGKKLFVVEYKTASLLGKDDWDKLPRGEVSRVQANGDRALLFVKVDGVEQTKTPMPLVREGGKWKIDLAGEPGKTDATGAK